MSERDTDVAAARAEYAGAVYGSLLAASVVAGSTVEGGPPSAADLVILLICTGGVFWITHVYAQLVSRGYPTWAFTWANVRGIARREWPLAQASFPPAIAAAFASALGASDAVTAWLVLCVAVAGQVTWAVVAALKTRWTTGVVVVSGIANLILGLVIIVLKTLVSAH